MHPRRTDLQILLAAERAWRDVTDASGVYAFVCHQSLPTVAGATASLLGMKRGHDLGAFSDGCSHPLDRGASSHPGAHAILTTGELIEGLPAA
jgi:hypothetical protein